MLDLNRPAPKPMWHVRDGSSLKEIDEERLVTWLGHRHLSGLEAARPKGAEPLRPLYSYPVFEPFLIAGRDARSSAIYREWLRMRFAVVATLGLAIGYALYLLVLKLPTVVAVIVGAVLVCGFPLMAQSSLTNLWRHRQMGEIESMKNTFD